MMKKYIQPDTEIHVLHVQPLMDASTDNLNNGEADPGEEGNPINFAPHRGWFEESEE